MTEEEREKLIEDMAQTIYVMLEVRDGYRDEYRLSREPLYVQRKYQNVARPTLVIAEEAISKDYRARIAELEAALTPLAEMDYWIEPHHNAHDSIEQCNQLTVAEILAARAALKAKRDD
jgi:hypothetical protein